MASSSDDDDGTPSQYADIGKRRLDQLPVLSKDLDKRAKKFNKSLFNLNAPCGTLNETERDARIMVKNKRKEKVC